MKDCNECSNCVSIGDGDYICIGYPSEQPPIVIISDYAHTKDFFICDGNKWDS